MARGILELYKKWAGRCWHGILCTYTIDILQPYCRVKFGRNSAHFRVCLPAFKGIRCLPWMQQARDGPGRCLVLNHSQSFPVFLSMAAWWSSSTTPPRERRNLRSGMVGIGNMRQAWPDEGRGTRAHLPRWHWPDVALRVGDMGRLSSRQTAPGPCVPLEKSTACRPGALHRQAVLVACRHAIPDHPRVGFRRLDAVFSGNGFGPLLIFSMRGLDIEHKVNVQGSVCRRYWRALIGSKSVE